MTIVTANALFRYFETLYNLNQNLIVLCGTDVYDHLGEQERRIDEVIMAVPRLVPYSFDKKTGAYEISKNDGLMKFSDDIQFLEEDYESIFQKHKDFLEKAKKVRNKLEHEMHGARVIAAISGTTSMFSVTYEVSENDITLCAAEIIAFVKDMNILFSKIQELAHRFAQEHKYDDHPYYRRLVRYDFADFNKIYDSDLLHILGKALLPF